VIRAKKSLGQNFLVDAAVSRRIVDAVAPRPGDIIFEIGPGTGALTRLLVERAGLVAAVEIDRRLVNQLVSTTSANNLSIIEADALALDWDSLVEQSISSWHELNKGVASDPRLRVVANLPYYISTPIIERLIALRGRLFDMTLMLQKEVVERIASPPGSREYGYLSVLVQFYCDAEKLFDVAPSAFNPAPKVRSAIVRLALRDRPAVSATDEKRFFSFVGAAFAQRRKTISNNLKAATGTLHFVRPIEAALEASGVKPQRRAETLSLEEFGALYDALFTE
jgi:16S rRNA (adenine1518-N6/adenine1519-N6)-dimethyltransferase